MDGVVADMRPPVLRNGRNVAPSVSIFDPMVARGDGCFEALRSYGGALFGLAEHLARLARSAAALDIQLPPIPYIGEWARRVAAQQGSGVIRIFVSQGQEGTNVYVLSAPLPDIIPEYRLLPLAAPWHPAGEAWELAGVKTLSYAPNMAATRTSQAAGYDDALLLSRDGTLLEGPTSAVLWVVRGVIETASLDLGILDSVTRRIALRHARGAGIEIHEGHYPLERILAADEIAILSSVKEVLPVVAVGEHRFDPGPVTALLARAYRRAVDDLIHG